MNKNELKVGYNICFEGEKLPMKLKAIGGKFAICTRKLHRRHDADLLHFEVERGCYFTFTEAYDDLKNEIVYSCLDFESELRAPHNLIFNPYDFNDQDSIKELLKDLEKGRVELSKRYNTGLLIDWVKTTQERKELRIELELKAKKLLKKGDRVRCTKCPGTKRTFTFDHWDGIWMVSKSGINEYHPVNVDLVNGIPFTI